MAFTVKLQTNSAEKNALDKYPEDVLSLSGTLKNETSIIDPVITFACNLEDVTNVNYMTITDFGRSYFVTNIRSIRKGLVEISGHVDVLSSFATQIRTNKAIIRKNEKKWNLYLNDGTFKVYQNPIVLTQPFPSGFTSRSYVLAVAGN